MNNSLNVTLTYLSGSAALSISSVCLVAQNPMFGFYYISLKIY